MPTQHNTSLSQPLILWFKNNSRPLPWRTTNNPYFIWVSEVMLQQTQVKTVIPYYLKFLDRFPSVTILSDSDLQDVLKVWEGLGYYGRARNLHKTAQIIVKNHSGHIPYQWEQLRQLPGIGNYIASAVLSIAFNQAYAVVDGNVKRVMSRLLQIDTPVNLSSAYKCFQKITTPFLNPDQPGTFNQALMELGALICKPKNPVCLQCPLQSSCRSYQNTTVEDYPKRKPRQPAPLHRISIGIVIKNKQMLITCRKPEGLLGGLWEFPGGKIQPDETPEAACIRTISKKINLTVDIQSSLTRVSHAYTHFKIIADVFICNYLFGAVTLNDHVDHQWITLSDIQTYAFPKSNHKFIPLLYKQAKHFGLSE